MSNLAYQRNLKKRGTYSYSYKKNHLKKHKYHSPIELDAATKGKGKLFKEEINERCKNKLYFEYDLRETYSKLL